MPAGIEDETGGWRSVGVHAAPLPPPPRLRGRIGRGLLAEPRQKFILKLHARLHRDFTIELAEGLHAPPALLARLCARFGHGETRHRQHETRIDAVVAGLDAIPREHAGRRPTPRRLRAVAVAQDVDHPGDNLLRRRRDAGRRLDGADLDAFPATGAGIDDFLNAALQRVFTEISHEAYVRWVDRLKDIVRRSYA